MNPWSYGVGLNQGFSIVMLGISGEKIGREVPGTDWPFKADKTKSGAEVS